MKSAIHYDDYSQAIKYLKMVLPEMAKLKIPTTPENYAAGKLIGRADECLNMAKAQGRNKAI